jgi:hypothetical protein
VRGADPTTVTVRNFYWRTHVGYGDGYVCGSCLALLNQTNNQTPTMSVEIAEIMKQGGTAEEVHGKLSAVFDAMPVRQVMKFYVGRNTGIRYDVLTRRRKRYRRRSRSHAVRRYIGIS